MSSVNEQHLRGSQSPLLFSLAATATLSSACHATQDPVLPDQVAETIAGDSSFIAQPPDFKPPVAFSVANRVPVVDFLAYPIPDYESKWSHWGTGVIHSNGMVYSAVGDRRGIDGNTYLFEFDPSARSIRRLAHLQAAMSGFVPGDFGFGKIHGRVDEGLDGRLYFAGWGGRWRDDPKYAGGRVFSFDVARQEFSDLGVPVPSWGSPSTRLYTDGSLLYGEFQNIERTEIDFVAVDVRSGRVIFRGGHDGPLEDQPRAFFVDADGNAYYGNGGGTLEVYDRAANSLRPFPARMPGKALRRTTRPAADGVLYGVTKREHVLFRLDPSAETITPLVELFTEVAAMDLDPTDRYIYYVAGQNHSDADGTQLVQVDLESDAAQKVIAFLDGPIEERFDYSLGYRRANHPAPAPDSYNLIVSGDGRTVFVTFNGTVIPSGRHLPAFLAIHVPEGEAVFLRSTADVAGPLSARH
jgi:hypothetical protein